MPNLKKTGTLLGLVLWLACPCVAGADLYKATLVRAAPGELLNLIQFYRRDIKHFAESADISEDRENEAAKAAGFGAAANISPFLRTLIAEHHDTLAVAIR